MELRGSMKDGNNMMNERFSGMGGEKNPTGHSVLLA